MTDKAVPKLQDISHCNERATVTCTPRTDGVNIRAVIVSIRAVDITVCASRRKLVKSEITGAVHAASVEYILLKIDIEIHA